MQKRNLLILTGLAVLLFGGFATFYTPQTFGAPTSNFQKTILPIADSLYELGTSTAAWLRLTSDEVCLNGTCRTTWPSASGTGTGNVSTSTTETAGQLAYWTTTGGTPATLGKVATTSVSCSGSVSCSAFDVLGASPITITGSGGASFGQTFGLTTNIFTQSALAPTTTQNLAVNGTGTSTFAGGLEAWRQVAAPYFHATGTTATSTFAGDVSLPHAKYLTAHGIRGDASDGLYIVANNYTNVADFGLGNSANSTFYGGVNIDGATRLATSLTGLAYLSSGAVSATTNGTNGQVLAMSGGVPAFVATTTFSGGLTYSGGNVTADLGTSITVGELASADFGDWTCNGTTCTVDANAIALATDTTGNYVATLADSGGSTLTISGSGSENAAVTAGINLANANTWTGKQNLYGTASSTLFSANRAYFGATATSTFGTDGALSVATSLTVPTLTSALTQTDANGLFAEYAGTSCTNQFVRALSALGIATCASVDLANDTTGTLTVAKGGTGTTTAPAGQVLYGGNGAYQSVATGTVSAGTGISLSATFYGLLNAASIAIDTAANLVWTGAHDFGGATSLEVPNGSAPTVDAIGEIALDTTNNQLLVATSTNASFPSVFSSEESKTLLVSTSTLTYMGSFAVAGTTTLRIGYHKRAIKITDLYCAQTGAGTSTIAIGSGTATSTYIQAGNFAAGSAASQFISVAARSPIYIDFGTLLGTPAYWTCDYTFLYDRT